MKKVTMKRRGIIHFSRWNRKGWSAFASMNREIKICVLSVAMSMISSAVLTGADKKGSVHVADSAGTTVLKESKVTSSPPAPARSPMPQTPLYVRSREAAAPLQTYESALRLNPSVDIRERGAKGAQADMEVRGGTSDQTMVMLNGINFTDARTGHQSHSLPIDLEAVSGIGLVDGMPGAGALSGAVNITARGLFPQYLRSEVSAGQYGYMYAGLSGAYTWENAGVFASASLRNSDGYRHNTDYRNYNAYIRAEGGTGRTGHFDFQAGAQKRRFGSNGFYAAYNPDQYEETSTYLASLRWSSGFGPWNVAASVSYRKNFDRYDWTRGTPMNWHNTDNAGAEVRADVNWAAGNTLIAADWMYNHIFSSNLGEPLDSPAGKDGRYKCAKSRNTANAYVRHSKTFGIFSLSATGGAGITPYGTTALWSAAAGVYPVDGLSIKASAHQSMRLPTFTDLYYTSKAQINNLDLIPEKAITYSLGINWKMDTWNAGVYTYLRDCRDLIAWVWRDELTVGDKHYTSVWHSEQQTKMLVAGVEASAEYCPDHGILRRIKASYGFIDSSRESKLQTSSVMDYMRHKAVLSAHFSFFKRLDFVVTGSVFDRFGSYIEYQFGDDNQPLRDESGVMITENRDFAPYFLLDMRLSYDFRRVTIYLDVNNATNTGYRDFGGIAMPGIWASAGLVVTVR